MGSCYEEVEVATIFKGDGMLGWLDGWIFKIARKWMQNK